MGPNTLARPLPLPHFMRMLKGLADLDVDAAALVAFTLMAMTIAVTRFRQIPD